MKKIAFILVAFLTSCLSNQNNDNTLKTRDLDINDDKITVIFDEVTKSWFERKNYKFFKPTKNDFIETENIIKKAIEKGEFNFLKEPILFSIKEYYKQYICYFDNNNHKIIRINAFCRNIQTPVEINGETVWEPFDWKNKLFVVNDGGKCYWTAIINLSKRELNAINVNGEV